MRELMLVVTVAMLCALPGAVCAETTNATDTAASNMVITARQLDLDYGRNIATFDGDVVVEDAGVKMTSDLLTVIFDTNQAPKSVTAKGNVHIYSEKGTGNCKKAIYLAGKAEVILLGDAVLERDGDLLSGDKITVWLNEERVAVDRRATLVISPRTMQTRGKGLRDGD